MNVFFRIGDEIVTPALQGSILPGITRMSCIELLRSWGYQVTERKLAIDELYEAYQKGQLKEAFGSGIQWGKLPDTMGWTVEVK